MVRDTSDARIPLAGLSMAMALLALDLPSQSACEGWKLLTLRDTPGERTDYMAAHFAARELTILFSGRTVAGSIPQAGTWSWDGFDWTEINTQNAPTPRSRAAMAYDPIRERIVLFGGVGDGGGFQNSVIFGDTWEFDGHDWTQLALTTNPPAMVGSQMAWDPIGQRLLMYGGGRTFLANLSSDTWVFDGSDWVQLSPANNAGTLKDHRMATDTNRNRIVLFGGIDREIKFFSTGVSNKTWEWDGGDWIAKSSEFAPHARRSFGMTYDSRLGLTLVSYGTDAGGGRNYADTWDWDGTAWRDNFCLEPKPKARGLVHLVENPNTGRILLYGGNVSAADPGQNVETWVLGRAVTAGYKAFGAGCFGTAGRPTMTVVSNTPPVVGRGMTLAFADLPLSPQTLALGVSGISRLRWAAAGQVLPLDLGTFGMPGCSLLVSPNRIAGPLMVSASGTADWHVLIPAEPSLVGENFYMQGFVTDPGANALGLTATAAVEVLIGLF